jgi:hypothetical protein
MNRFAERSTRKDVVARARVRVWCECLRHKGRTIGIRAIKDIGDAIQQELPQPTPAWLALSRQLPRAMDGILPRGCEKRMQTPSETRLQWLVRSIDALEAYRDPEAVFDAPLWSLSSPSADVPQRLSEAIDGALRSLSLWRLSREDSKSPWGLPSELSLRDEDLHFRRWLSFERSIDAYLATPAGCSHEQLLRRLEVLALLHLESCAARRFDVAEACESALNRLMSSDEYMDAFGGFDVEFRKAIQSRILWRRIGSVAHHPRRADRRRPLSELPDRDTSPVLVNPEQVRCVIIPTTCGPQRMSAATFWSITSGVFGTY